MSENVLARIQGIQWFRILQNKHGLLYGANTENAGYGLVGYCA